MNDNDVKKIVKEGYGRIAKDSGSCCSYSLPAKDISKMIGYSDEEMSLVPEANMGLGCGNPTGLGKIKKGDTVLDLGSGAGFDVFLAAKKTGKGGKVIGVDMTEEMIRKSRELAKKYGYNNVEFRLGDIEKLPVDDNTADVVISNCVINLVPDKSKVFRNAYRVLKPKGSMFISDIVLLSPLTEKQKNDKKLLCGCVSGAMLKDDYLKIISDAGFEIKILEEDKEISKAQYRGVNLESLKLELTKR